MAEIGKFRKKMEEGFREYACEFNQLQHETNIYANALETTKMKYHNLTTKVEKLEKQSGTDTDPRIDVTSKYPLKTDRFRPE